MVFVICVSWFSTNHQIYIKRLLFQTCFLFTQNLSMLQQVLVDFLKEPYLTLPYPTPSDLSLRRHKATRLHMHVHPSLSTFIPVYSRVY